MGSRFPSHQLSNGLYVSGRPEQPKEKPPIMSSVAMPYTGGDIKKSGELGKMFDLHTEKSRKSGPLTSASFRGTSSHSGPVMPNASCRTGYSGSLSSSIPGSGPLPPVLPTTGLITSGPISCSGPLNSNGAPRKVSGPLDSSGSMKLHKNSIARNQAITNLSRDVDYPLKGSLPKAILWSVVLLFVMGFMAGGFILGAVHNAVLLIAVLVTSIAVATFFIWNVFYGKRAVIRFIAQYPDAELQSAKDGQYVKVTGVVTCGNLPLESSYCKVPRCVYTSTSLYEYRDWDSKAANPMHRRFTWGLRSMERHVVDFYISDFQSGLRALVKAGCGAQVTPYVDESVIADMNTKNKDLAPDFLNWLRKRNLSSDDRAMRLKEGYIKEGSTISVMGIVQRNDNVLMIVQPPEPFSTGYQWSKCILPVNLQGLILRCEEDSSKVDVIPV